MKPRNSPAINMETLQAAYFEVKEADLHLDRETWQSDGDALDQNLHPLYDGLKRGRRLSNAARPSPSIGIPGLEQQILRRAALEMRYALY
jgi:hypothetical protein